MGAKGTDRERERGYERQRILYQNGKIIFTY
jgi:hypothetical protein